MKKILFINACVRPESRTKILAETLLSKLHGERFDANLEQMDLHPLTRETLNRRDELLSANAISDPTFECARRFSDADIIVIAAPYWDCSFPSAVKVFVEHVMVNGITFTYSEDGYPLGKCKAEKIYYVSTAGGPVVGSNFGYEYIKTLSQLYWGIPEVELFQAENLDLLGADTEKILGDAIRQIRNAVEH